MAAPLQIDTGSTRSANTGVTGAIRQASRLTGTSFQYLLATAKVESNLNPKASVATSSARGLFQFIEQTWLATMKEAGAALGYGAYANAIEKTASGHHVVRDPAMRRQILDLRSDATANALMAGAFTKTNAAKLAGRLGRQPTDGELYMAHFLGPAGAGRLLNAAATKSGTSAASMFPTAASANRSIFYDRSGQARTVNQVADLLNSKYNVSVAATGARPDRDAPAPAVPTFLSYIPTQSATEPAAFAQLRLSTPAGEKAASGGNRTDPIGQKVRELWGQQIADTSSRISSAHRQLDLFTDGRRNVSGLFNGT
ncbi:MAG: transglycosylase SLT domain-containing protein [Pseudorhodoplanes sp.]